MGMVVRSEGHHRFSQSKNPDRSSAAGFDWRGVGREVACRTAKRDRCVTSVTAGLFARLFAVVGELLRSLAEAGRKFCVSKRLDAQFCTPQLRCCL